MIVKVLCVGKLKEKYLKDAVFEYSKRLGRYARVDIVCVADEPTKEKLSEKERDRILQIEGERLLSKLCDGDYCMALDIVGKEYSSPELAYHLQERMNAGKSRICFIIGGSLGLSDDVLLRADERISFSKMTFPHQLMRVILLEQVYRAFKIMKNEPYHK